MQNENSRHHHVAMDSSVNTHPDGGSMSGRTALNGSNAAMALSVPGGDSGALFLSTSAYASQPHSHARPQYAAHTTHSTTQSAAWHDSAMLDSFSDPMSLPQGSLASPYSLPTSPAADTLYNSSNQLYNSCYADGQLMSLDDGLADLNSMTLPSSVDPFSSYLPDTALLDGSSPYAVSSTACSPHHSMEMTSSPLDYTHVRRDSTSSTGGTTPKKVCTHCQTTATPLWRRDPASGRPLCNACGLYVQQHDKSRPQKLIDADAAKAAAEPEEDEAPDDPSGRSCSHCKATKTSVWRRCKTTQELLCNACGVYVRLKGVPRPVSYKQKQVKPRMRHVERPSPT
jgi:hypothetical protein